MQAPPDPSQQRCPASAYPGDAIDPPWLSPRSGPFRATRQGGRGDPPFRSSLHEVRFGPLRWKPYMAVPPTIAVLYLIYVFCFEEHISIPEVWLHPKISLRTGKDPQPVVVTAACGVGATKELLFSLRSLILFSHVPFRYVVIADGAAAKLLYQVQRTLPPHVQLEIVGIYKRIPWKYRPWHDAFHEPCTWQRLYLPEILPHDSLILYVDVDLLFFEGIEDVWQVFSQLGPKQAIGITMEHEELSKNSIYQTSENGHVPHYGKTGIQAGIFVMDLKKMRSWGWKEEIQGILEERQGDVFYKDQDVLNIYGHRHQEAIKILPCRWNFRQEHCRYRNNRCLSAHNEGIGILHGAGRSFNTWEFPGIRTAVDVFGEWDFLKKNASGLADEMERRIAMLDDDPSCDPLRLRFFSKTLRKQSSQTLVASGFGRTLRWKPYLAVPPVVVVLYLTYIFCLETRISLPEVWLHPKILAGTGKDPRPVVVTAACGVGATKELLLSLRSLILFSHVPFRYVVIADEPTAESLYQVQRTLPPHVKLEVMGIYKLIPWKYRPWIDFIQEPCHWQRLFLPEILPHDSLVLYVDVDLLFFAGIEYVWQAFSQLGPKQAIGITMEHEETSTNSIYQTVNAQLPHYGKTGLQAGIYSIDLSKLRSLGWKEEVQDIMDEQQGRLYWMDQDVLNVYGHRHPEAIKILPCRWNFRQEHCRYETNRCESAYKDGIGILHGAGGSFETWEFPGIRTAADVFREWDFLKKNASGLADEMERRIAMLDEDCSCDPLRLRFFSKTLGRQSSQSLVASAAFVRA
ncbi:unnamed protein product [Darwinula stevensoni]|uniref:UDP-D-xylose:beta-D-glucoside alpha-1,3-D-xylosyltransferase n=1 Tax=Darwinula stevensoni TaxID=69355 RepID=A0A7R8XH44_9CRUS|nr:unnamed protein product [Darwinula stevensoni]CAG0893168.1 unnamed protein product [Darwinula stevensoni]